MKNHRFGSNEDRVECATPWSRQNASPEESPSRLPGIRSTETLPGRFDQPGPPGRWRRCPRKGAWEELFAPFLENLELAAAAARVEHNHSLRQIRFLHRLVLPSTFR